MVINTLTMTVMFFSLFYLLKEFVFISKDPKKMYNIHSRVNSLVHGIIQIVLPLMYLLNNDSSIQFQKEKFLVKIVCVSTGYFLYDLPLAEMYKLNSKELTIHHIFGFLGLFLSGMLQGGAFYTALGLFAAEVTNPFMNFKYFLRFYNMRHTKIYELIDAIYLVSYIIFRGGIGTYGIVSMYFDPNASIFIMLMFCAIYLQSMNFIFKMINMLKSKVKQMKCREKEGIQYFWFKKNPEVINLSYIKEKETNIW